MVSTPIWFLVYANSLIYFLLLLIYLKNYILWGIIGVGKEKPKWLLYVFTFSLSSRSGHVSCDVHISHVACLHLIMLCHAFQGAFISMHMHSSCWRATGAFACCHAATFNWWKKAINSLFWSLLFIIQKTLNF